MNDILTAERARTGNYGYDFDSTVPKRRCPICGAVSPEHVYENREAEIIGCSECLEDHFTYDYDDEEWEARI